MRNETLDYPTIHIWAIALAAVFAGGFHWQGWNPFLGGFLGYFLTAFGLLCLKVKVEEQEAKVLPPVKENFHGYSEDEVADPCEDCGAPFELVRPGKSQPTCNCHLKCLVCHKEMNYYHGDHPKDPGIHGFLCPEHGIKGNFPVCEN